MLGKTMKTWISQTRPGVRQAAAIRSRCDTARSAGLKLRAVQICFSKSVNDHKSQGLMPMSGVRGRAAVSVEGKIN